jgi:proline iminopeptidase
LYAQQHTERVAGLILRAVFLARQQDMAWFIQKPGVALIYPEVWQCLYDSIQVTGQQDMVQGLYNAIWHKDVAVVQTATKAWQAWSGQVALGAAYQPSPNEEVTDKMVKQVRMELHYAQHRYFISENQILANCDKLAGIWATIIHGRNDLVCPLEAGWVLHQALPDANYCVLPNAGHIAQNEAMINALVTATDQWLAVRY